VISHKWGKDRKVLSTYLWPFVRWPFNGQDIKRKMKLIKLKWNWIIIF
jgi:hypothetical protein